MTPIAALLIALLWYLVVLLILFIIGRIVYLLLLIYGYEAYIAPCIT